MNEQIVIATFYKFARIEDTAALREELTDFCEECHIKGTILIAPEGINSTVAGTRAAIDALLSYLRSDERFSGLVHKESYADTVPFDRMKVRLKKEIVTFKQPDIDPTSTVGTYVEPDKWNQLISDPDVVVIDTRNDFEVSIGTFKGAINPKTEAFSDLPDFVEKHLDPKQQKRVAMFCTGGIRCEKATAYMLKQGFEEVYHLNGGILRYLETMPQEESLWEGECFVFDNRVSVDHALNPGQARFCEQCKTLLKDGDAPCPNCGAFVVHDHPEQSANE